MNKLQALLAENEYLILDGAMGTMLMNAGLEQGGAPELWNVTAPERIRDVHRRYIAAGSQLILTNSFGGTRFRLQLHELQDRVVELNRAAAELARTEADAAPHTVVVAGSMGPTGQLLVPMGAMTFEEARAAFAEQATGLVQGGVDVLWVETMSDLEEIRAAVEGIRSATDLPVVTTMSFDTHGRTMMGVTPTQAAETLNQFDVVALGANCGLNLPDTEAAIAAMHAALPNAVIVAKANAGIPHWEGSDLVYDGTPTIMAGYARRARALGARLIGACCGSTDEHIRQMADALQEAPPPSLESNGAPQTQDSPAETETPSRRPRARSRRSRRRRQR
ncbi:MAG: betaine--homocysteine S-methyltransferase [Candidatus Promineifilaceae bacterium]|nr:betaine--homocysteine S-methyltransferase [Candidatus Promineifilaceae bacterium]